MANPMRWFRRHQKLMMVFFGVGLMAVFGLGSVVSMVNPSDLGVGRENPVIAVWKGGEVKRDFLNNLRFRHFQTMRFLSAVQQTARKQKGESFNSLAIPISSIVPTGEFKEDEVDRRLLDKFLMAEMAKEEGIIVDDAMVDEYIAQVAGYVPFSRNDMVEINREANQGQAALEVVRRHLKLELAAQQASSLISVSIIGNNPRIARMPNPTDAIELYTKSTRRIECQILPIEVDPESISEQPSSTELRKIYDEGKYIYPQFDGETPGFKIGKKVKVQYFVANQDTFLQNEINKLTDAEVQAEYEKLVEQESPIVMETIPDESQPEIPTGTEDAAPILDEIESDGEASDLPPPLIPDDAGSTGEEDSAPAPNESDSEPNEDENEEEGNGISIALPVQTNRYVKTIAQQEETGESDATKELEESLKKVIGQETESPESTDGDQEENEPSEEQEDGPGRGTGRGPGPSRKGSLL